MPFRFVEEDIEEETPKGTFRFVEEEGKPGALLRTAARTPARLFSTVAGAIPDLALAAHGADIEAEEGLAPPGLSAPPELRGERGLANLLRLIPKKKAEELSSSALMERFHETTGDRFRAQGKGEEFVDEVLGDVAALMLPVGGKVSLARALGTSLGANLAKEGITYLGGGPKSQTATKLGTMFLLGLVQPGRLKEHIRSLYRQAEAAIPEGAAISAKPFEKELRKLQTTLKKGTSTPSKSAVLKPTEELLSKIKDGRIHVDELVEAKRNINELMGDPALLKQGKNLFKKLAKDVDQSLELYGKENTQFLKPFREANEAFGGVAQSEKVSRFLSKHKKRLTGVNPQTLILFETLTGHPKLAAAPAGAGGLVKGFELLKRVNANPTLRKYYLNVINKSLEGNSAAMLTNLRRLDEVLSSSSEDKGA